MRTHNVILLVEDNACDAAVFLDIAGKIYRNAWFVTLKNVHEAIQYLAGCGDFADREKFPLPTIAFVDLVQPGGGHGSELIKWMRQQPAFKNLQVVVLTGGSGLHHFSELYDWGADSFILKSPDRCEMLHSLQELNDYWNQRGFLSPLPAR
jgi:CheY-like chemotaxis protein